jgi:hypothetical protein
LLVHVVDIILPERSSTVVKALTRRLCLALVAMGMLSVVGCGPDNASEGEAASKKLGDPGKPDPKGLPTETISQPKTEAERGKQGPGGSVLQQGKKAGGAPAGK